MIGCGVEYVFGEFVCMYGGDELCICLVVGGGYFQVEFCGDVGDVVVYGFLVGDDEVVEVLVVLQYVGEQLGVFGGLDVVEFVV